MYLFDNDTLKRMADQACSGSSIMSNSVRPWFLFVRVYYDELRPIPL
jgi:hypothetical protein